MTRYKLLQWLIVSIALFMLAACGGGSASNEGYDLHGVIQKGHLVDGKIEAHKLEDNGSIAKDAISSQVKEKGQYTLKTEWDGLLFLHAKGHFFNEITGQNSSDEVDLFAIVNTEDAAFTEKVNLNLFTSLEAVRVLELLQKGTPYTVALTSTRKSMKKEFGLARDIRVTDLDIRDLNGSLGSANTNLLLFSAALLSVQEHKGLKKMLGAGMGAYGPTARLYTDFEDDGKIGGAFKVDFERMQRLDPVAVLDAARDALEMDVADVVDQYPDWFGVILSDLSIDSFVLKETQIEDYVMGYHDEETVFVGTHNSTTRLIFELSSHATKASGDYDVNVTATAPGQESLLIADSIHIAGHAATIEIMLTDALRAFLDEAYSHGREVIFRATSDVLRSVLAGYVSRETDVLPVFGELSDSMEPNTTITSATFLGNCDRADSLTMKPRLAISGIYRGIGVEYGVACVTLTYNSENYHFDAHLYGGSGVVTAPIETEIGGHTIKIYADTIDSEKLNIEKVELLLPAGHSIHSATPNGTVNANGSKTILLSNPPDNKISHDQVLGALSFSGRLPDRYLHGKNLPFYFKLNKYTLDEDGLGFKKTYPRYVFEYANRHTNNTERFKHPVKEESVDIVLKKDGIKAVSPIAFDTAKIQMQYPYAGLNAGSFSVGVAGSTLTDISKKKPDDYITMDYSQNCEGVDCANGSEKSNIGLGGITDTKIYPDGASVSIQKSEIGEVRWGAKGSKSTFVRTSDVGARVYMPGFELPTENAAKIGAYLQGVADYKSDEKNLTYYDVTDKNSKKGRYLFAGINVGSLPTKAEVEEAPEAISLNGKPMDVLLGENETPQELISNASSKYYIRPSGITGVFNRNWDEFTQTVYGYKMAFSQFAFRQVENTIDEVTMIDGLVTVPGKGDFEVAFSGLGLDCRGGLNSGHVLPCDGEDGANCSERLLAWHMDTNFTAIGFEGKGECSTNKQLSVGHVLGVAALKTPLGLNTIWTPEGLPQDSKVVGSSYNQMDGTDSKRGYDIAFTDHIKLASSKQHDWLEADAGFGLPFWDEPKMSLRLTNKNRQERAPSIVVARGDLGYLEKDDSNTNIANRIANDYNQTIQYTWANLITFGMPVYYDATNSTEEVPQFLGRTQDGIDLMVMKAKSGVDYIDPETTSMSFGASADFEALANIKLHLDINDPESIRKVDALLAKAGISGNPIQNTVGTVVDGLRVGNRLLDQGITLTMEELIKKALDAADDAADNPLEKMADILSELHSIPHIVNDRVKTDVQNAIASKLDSAIKALDGALTDIDEKSLNTYEAIINNAEVNSSLQAILAHLSMVDEGISKYEKLKKVIDDLSALLENIENIGDYKDAIIAKADSLFAPDGGSCSWDYTAHNDPFRPIGEATDTVRAVNDALQNIDLGTLRSFATQIERFTGLDAEDIVSLADEVDGMAASLNSIVNEMDQTIQAQFQTNVCDRISDIKSKMFELFDDLNTEALTNNADATRTALDNISGALNEEGGIGKYIYAIQTAANDIKDVITSIHDSEEMTESVSMRNLIAEKLRKLEILPNSEDLDGNNMLSKLQTEVMDEISKTLNTLVFEKMEDVARDLEEITPNISAEDMKRILAAGLLQSEPIQAINRSLHLVLTPIADNTDKLASKLLDGIDRAVNKQLAKVLNKVNEALNKATSSFADAIPIKAARMDGYAIIRGDRLSKAHIGSEFEVKGSDDKSSFSLNAALDMWNSGAEGTGGCGGDENDGNFNIQISTRDITMPLGPEELKVDMVLLGITMNEAGNLIGVFGAITSESGFDFDTMKLYNLGLAVGIGTEETYLGAMAAAKLETVQLGVNFLLGKVCNQDVIEAFIPEAIGDFITIPDNGFAGGLVYGEAQVPVWDNGCALRVVVRAKVGTWYLINNTGSDTFGGLVGGGAFGQALCIATLGGELKVMAEKSAGGVKFQGSGWGAAGIGSCDSSWSSVRDSRRDRWCGTGDAQFGALYHDGWELLDIKTSAIH